MLQKYILYRLNFLIYLYLYDTNGKNFFPDKFTQDSIEKLLHYNCTILTFEVLRPCPC